MEQYQGGPQEPNNQNQQQYRQPIDYQPQPYPNNCQNPADPFRGKAIASMVLGIVSLVFFWAGYGALLALVCGVIAIVLGAQARKGAEAMGLKPSGMATAGLIMGIIGGILSLIGFISCVACMGLYGVAINNADSLSHLVESYMY